MDSYLSCMKSVPLPWPRIETESETAEYVREAERQDLDDGVFRKIIGLSRTRAWEIVGGLSRPSKMPCFSWGIPAHACITGGKLAQIEGSVCQHCYALKGYFRTHRVQRAYQRRLDRWGDPRWVEAMVKLVYWQTAETGVPYFRWFDSGDLQGIEMLRRICAVANGTPEIRHWLPTREYRIVAALLESETFPQNLTVRISGTLIDDQAPRSLGLPTSTAHATVPLAESTVCTATDAEPVNCRGCRACWDEEVKNVSYPLH